MVTVDTDILESFRLSVWVKNALWKKFSEDFLAKRNGRNLTVKRYRNGTRAGSRERVGLSPYRETAP